MENKPTTETVYIRVYEELETGKRRVSFSTYDSLHHACTGIVPKGCIIVGIKGVTINLYGDGETKEV